MKRLLTGAALAFALSSCSGGDAGSNTSAETPRQNLAAENFSTTIDSDNAVMNEADTEQLNRSDEEGKQP